MQPLCFPVPLFMLSETSQTTSNPSNFSQNQSVHSKQCNRSPNLIKHLKYCWARVRNKINLAEEKCFQLNFLARVEFERTSSFATCCLLTFMFANFLVRWLSRLSTYQFRNFLVYCLSCLSNFKIINFLVYQLNSLPTF